MLFHRLKSSCKLLSVGLGFFSSYLAYQYQQTVSKNNIGELHNWLTWKSQEAYHETENYLLHYCRMFSSSPVFHRFEMTSFLIYLANSKSLFLHELGVKLLAVVQFPDNVDLKRYIEKCDYTALIGLARIENANALWFETLEEENNLTNTDDIYLSYVKHRMDNILQDVKTHLPAKQENCSTWLYERVAKFDKLPEDPVPNLMSDFCTERDSSHSSKRETNMFRKNMMTYLDIFRRYSNDKLIVSNYAISCEMLSTLKEIMVTFPDDKNVQIICGNIIANLAMDERNRKAIVEGCFLPLVMQWKIGDFTALEIVANRILYNLDVKNSKSLLRDGIYILHPLYRTDEKFADVDVVFVHGVYGSPFHTWRQNDNSNNIPHTQCWPKDWLPRDIPNSRVICVQYESSLSDWLLLCPIEKVKYSLDTQADSIKKKLQSIGVGDRPIIWVCHSMGGLIVKKLLLSSGNFIKDKSEDILCSTKGVVFYSVPHLGSPIASQSEKARYILFPSTEVHELSGNGSKLKDLHVDFANLKNQFDITCVDFGESRPLTLPYVKLKTMVVPSTSCDVGYGKFIMLEDASHQETCKPVSKSDQRYTEVGDMIRKIIQSKFEK